MAWPKGRVGYWKGKKMSDEAKHKMRCAKQDYVPWMKGKHHSEESKQKMRYMKEDYIPWNKGIPMRQDTKQKLSHIKKGRKINRLKKHPTGWHHSEETRKKMSKSGMGHPVSKTSKKRWPC